MMTMTMESRSNKKPYHQDQLRQLERKVGDRLDDLLDYFNLRDGLRRAKRFYVGGCPVHGGDKKNAFNIFHTGYETVGNWRCFSHGCEKHFQPTVIGFIRGVLSHVKYGWRDKSDRDKECPFREAVAFAAQFVGEEDASKLAIDYEAFEKRRFASQMERIYSRNEPEVQHKIPRELVTSSLSIPAEYFVTRGFTKEVLVRYDVGLCTTPNREMYMRATVPIYDENFEHIIGCTGRSIFNQCPLCESYHNPIKSCPSERDRWKYSKWRHNYGFKGEFHLYNYWFAKEHIQRTGIAIIVEGPADVWRLEEAGIHNAVATFGAHLTEGQRAILDGSGAMALVVLTDPDQAGKLAAEAIRKDCGNTYGLHFPSLNGGDVGETDVILIQEKLLPILKQIQKDLGL